MAQSLAPGKLSTPEAVCWPSGTALAHSFRGFCPLLAGSTGRWNPAWGASEAAGWLTLWFAESEVLCPARFPALLRDASRSHSLVHISLRSVAVYFTEGRLRAAARSRMHLTGLYLPSGAQFLAAWCGSSASTRFGSLLCGQR